MKVLIDARGYNQLSRGRGIGRTIEGFTRALMNQGEPIDITILGSEDQAYDLGVIKHTSIWNVGKYDVYHVLDPMSVTLGYDNSFLCAADAKIRTSTFYDAIPMRGYAHGVSTWPLPIKEAYLNRFNCLAYLDYVFAISEHAKSSLLEFNTLAIAEDISVVPVGIDNGPRQNLMTGSPRADGVREIVCRLIEKQYPYILTVGGAEPHKNLALLKEVFFCIKPQWPNLKWVVCGNDSKWHDAMFYDALPGVVRLHDVSDVELSHLYNNAQALCMPSIEEGQGLPAFEAARFGTPLLLSRIQPFECLGVRPLALNVDSWIHALSQLQQNDKQDFISKANLEGFSWANVISQYINVWTRLLEVKK